MKVAPKSVAQSVDAARTEIPSYRGIEKWVSGAIRQRVLVVVALLLAASLGGYTFFQLRIDAVPDISISKSP
jgi:hypothetical protein